MTIVSKLRESLTLVLIALLPLHALGLTILTQHLAGSGKAPLMIFAIWKEVFLALLVFFAVLEIIFARDRDAERRVWSLDLLDWCILLGIALGASVSMTSWDFSGLLRAHLSLADRTFLVGFKYDFLPLVVFFFLRRVSWSGDVRRSMSWVLIGTGSLIAVFGLVTLFLPMEFFTALGYSDLHSLYRPDAPLASFQMVESTNLRRIQSVMSGPNQFGLWLLIPFAAALQRCIVTFVSRKYFGAVLSGVAVLLFSVTIAFTYSRSALLGAAAIVLLLFLWTIRGAVGSVFHRVLIIGSVGVLSIIVLSLGLYFAPQVVLRSQSLMGHLTKPAQALTLMRANPFGMGLGFAGPASNHFSDTCVFFDLGADISWAKKRTDICVFLGGVRKYPAGKVCDCPLLTENWYLQWGVEMGYAGLILCLLILLLPLLAMRKISPFSARAFPLLALAGLAVGGLFLHAFEDSAVAYTIWILLAVIGLHVPDPDYTNSRG